MPSGTPSQATHYAYGVTTAGGSTINDNDLLAQTQYPDPTTGAASAGQAETYTYDALGEATRYTDRNGTQHVYSYDSLGRETSDSVGTFGAGVDTSVVGLGFTYDDAGRVAVATSYGAGGTVVNQDTDTFDGFGQLAAEAQSVAGAVVTGTPTVGYTYDAANGDRLTGMSYPNGRTLGYNYGAAGSLTTAASQVTSLSDAAGTVQAYTYLGLSTPVTFADGNGITLSYLAGDGSASDGGDQYTGLDRFGRVVDQNWVDSSGTAVDEQQYQYDADSNVLSRRNMVLPGQSELYTYDGLNRLATFARGTLNSAGTAVAGTPTGTESWNLDAVGNWHGVTTNGTTTARVNNAQNQIVSTNGTTLAYDANGNTLSDDTGQQYVYDAWNRLVTVKNPAGTTVAAYTYDAQGRRVTETHGTAATALYYDPAGRVLEERQGGTPTAQTVWSPQTAGNVLVERDASSTGGTTLNRRLYVQQDSNGNVTALTDTTGAVVERYAYDPTGAVTVLSPGGMVVGLGASASAYAMLYLFQGGRADPATGLYRFGVRDYSPGLGRWYEQDPAGYVNGASRYQFVEGNPVAYVDPTGLTRDHWDWSDDLEDEVLDGVEQLGLNELGIPSGLSAFFSSNHKPIESATTYAGLTPAEQTGPQPTTPVLGYGGDLSYGQGLSDTPPTWDPVQQFAKMTPGQQLVITAAGIVVIQAGGGGSGK